MSRQIIGDELWAEMTDGERLTAVTAGRATLKQLSEGLLDGPAELRNACRELLARADVALESLLPPKELEVEELSELAEELTRAARKQKIQTKSRKRPAHKQRFGLPEGFVPRHQRFGRGVLLELNIYRLPDGREFIPTRPSGTLGGRQHLYALITPEQYAKGRRGSVYIRTDGRVFDYSVDVNEPDHDLFDTGFTIYDLERTGKYAPDPARRRLRRKKQLPKARSAASAAN